MSIKLVKLLISIKRVRLEGGYRYEREVIPGCGPRLRFTVLSVIRESQTNTKIVGTQKFELTQRVFFNANSMLP